MVCHALIVLEILSAFSILRQCCSIFTISVWFFFVSFMSAFSQFQAKALIVLEILSAFSILRQCCSIFTISVWFFFVSFMSAFSQFQANVVVSLPLAYDSSSGVSVFLKQLVYCIYVTDGWMARRLTEKTFL